MGVELNSIFLKLHYNLAPTEYVKPFIEELKRWL
jgi:hypothetical protein